MPILSVEGPPGNGKSAYGARAIARALRRRQPVVTNLPLREDYADFAAKHMVYGRSRRRDLSRELARLVFTARDPEELLAIRLRGAGEERGLAVLDEAPTWLNSRQWNADGREAANDWMRKHRHRGFRVLLLSQDGEMLDKHVRPLSEVTVNMRNLKRFKRFGLPIFPLNFFLAVHTWHATGKRFVVRREGFALGWWKNLYDTHGEAGADPDDDPSLIWLPLDALKPGDSPPAPADGPVGASEGSLTAALPATHPSPSMPGVRGVVRPRPDAAAVGRPLNEQRPGATPVAADTSAIAARDARDSG